MATISKITLKSGAIRYKAIVRSNGKLKTKNFTKRKNAKDWSLRIESDKELMEVIGSTSASYTLQELSDLYFEDYVGKDPTRPTRVQHWVNLFGDTKLMDINSDKIEDELYELVQGNAKKFAGFDTKGNVIVSDTGRKRSPSTANRYKAALSALFTYGVKHKKIRLKHNPCRGIENFTEANTKIRYLNQDDPQERAKLFEACKQSEWNKLYLLVLMATTTGARKGELLKLKWNDINFNERVATLHDTKNGDDRRIPVPQPVIDELNNYRKVGNESVFDINKNHTSTSTIDNYWYKARDLSGIQQNGNFRFHDLRHTAASYLALGQTPMLEIAQILGHKSLETTKIYAHLSDKHVRKTSDSIFGDILEK